MCDITFFTRLTSNTNTKENGAVLQKKDQHLYFCRDCLTRSPIHRQARVTFHNFAEVNFRDFLPTKTNVDSLTDRNEATDRL